jgi:hypothetical protein
MEEKKRLKYLANAEEKFQKEQLQAAAAVEAIDKSLAVIEQYKDELSEEDIQNILAQVDARKIEIEQFLLNARDKYVTKLKDLGDPRINPETGELV